MNLRQLAEQDLAVTLEDNATGFGWPVTLTDPNNVSANLTAQTQDIGLIIDPDTGVAVSGRTASAVLRISSIIGAGLELPEGEPRANRKPWRVDTTDTNGNAIALKVDYAYPDRILGTVTLQLGVYRNA
ncbi:hypothetical protein [Vibrio phage VP16T]|nr:hypothetical protein [Vibrio phage VP16T]